MEATFATLAEAGVDRDDLYLAWDFTVASQRNLSERHAAASATRRWTALGDAAPAFTVTSITPNTDDDIALQIAGTFTVPNFLTADGGPGNRVQLRRPPPISTRCRCRTARWRPASSATSRVTTATGTEPAHLVQYGHGLLGSDDEIDAGNVRAFANEHNVVSSARPSGQA